jgi:hypothetical protein
LPDRTVLNGSTFFSSGFFATTAGTRSRQYITWVYIGCETQVVPSWSKVAMRASGGTNCGLVLSVVALTSSMMACLAGPSFQKDSGSVCACAAVKRSIEGNTASAAKVESKVRRLIPEGSISFMFGLLANLCCARPISRAHEGGRLVPDRFDDGAFSSASLDRPALQHLLEQVRSQKIDILSSTRSTALPGRVGAVSKGMKQ